MLMSVAKVPAEIDSCARSCVLGKHRELSENGRRNVEKRYLSGENCFTCSIFGRLIMIGR